MPFDEGLSQPKLFFLILLVVKSVLIKFEFLSEESSALADVLWIFLVLFLSFSSKENKKFHRRLCNLSEFLSKNSGVGVKLTNVTSFGDKFHFNRSLAANHNIEISPISIFI